MHYLAEDLTSEAGTRAVGEWVERQFGGLDILVHILGGSSAPGGGFLALDDDVADD